VKVLVACEFSGVVREAFRKRGHDAWSCDLISATDGSRYHILGNAIQAARRKWDLIIAHPPCTHLTVAGARWFKGREREQQEAIAFAETLWGCCSRMAIENPIGALVDGRKPRVHHESPGIMNGMTRAQGRSITYVGVAEAMAEQWSN